MAGKMKLNVTFVRDRAGKELAVITDEHGHRMPCIRSVEVLYRYDELSEVKITLVVNRKDVTLGPKSE